MAKTSSDKILSRLKGLGKQMREGEQPVFSMPAIWENASEQRSEACDLVLTNQRLFGYIYTTFPRERLFLDALELREIKTISFRQKSFEALFRELFVSDGRKRVYIRATRKKSEAASEALRAAISEYVSASRAVPAQEGGVSEQVNPPAEQLESEAQAGEEEEAANPLEEQGRPHGEPMYRQQRIRQPLERSPLGIALLLVGGLLLEIVGALVWIGTGSLQTGAPLFLAGLVAVIVAIITRRQLR